MLTLVSAGPHAVVTLDTTDRVPVVETACTHCPFVISMVALTPIGCSDDVAAMADRLVTQHRTASHPELIR